MKIVSPAQMNMIDRLCINSYGIPGIVLMENAALAVVNEVLSALGGTEGRSIVVFAGRGNNGGDAFAVSRHLYNKGAAVRTYVLSEVSRITGDALTNLQILTKAGAHLCELWETVQGEGLQPVPGESRQPVAASNSGINSAADATVPEFTGIAGATVPVMVCTPEALETLETQIRLADLVVDGIFGTGLRGEVKGLPGQIIELINKTGKPVISIDIPSGISGETGAVSGSCIEAARTVTFGMPKTGLVIHPGCEHTGRLLVADIGIPRAAVEELDIRGRLTEAAEVRELLPRRKNESSKGDYGKALIISGSSGMTGSGCLAAPAALRSGAGLVYLGVPATLAPIYGAALREPVLVPLADSGDGHVSKAAIPFILDSIKGKDVLAVGPGLSAGEDIAETAREIIKNSSVPLVLDADALNALAKDLSVLKHLKVPAVITPHPGEMSRLTGRSIAEIQQNRIKTALEFSSEWGVTTVLKGARTVIALPDGAYYINPTGNSGMATAGTGDVLTGVIAGLTAQGADVSAAAVAGVYLHGLAGDLAAAKRGEYGMLAGDLVEELPLALKSMAGGHNGIQIEQGMG